MNDRSFHLMGDPELDQVFTEAYRKTLRRVDLKEKEKEFSDYLEALVEEFEKEISLRDLSPAERREFVQAFRGQLKQSRQDLEDRRKAAVRRKRQILSWTLSTVLVLGLIYLLMWKPFTSKDEVITRLDEQVEKVESGYGAYAEEYYKLLSTYRRKLGSDRVEEYSQLMYRELDEQFLQLLDKVEQGELVYFDDARKWAGYFPEKEERKTRRDLVDNAAAQWIGKTVDESVDKVIEGVKGLLEKVKEE